MAWHSRFSVGGFDKYKKISIECKKLTAKYHEKIETKIIQSNDTKKFFSYVNKKLNQKSKFPPIRRPDNTFAHSDEEKCNIFNDFFTSVFTVDDGQNPLPNFKYACTNNVQLDISPTVISKVLHNLNKNSCAGPDGIPGFFWHKLSYCLSYPLHIIFSLSFTTASLPNDWLTANVTPIHKSGDSSLAANYRPISLTSIPCKVFETIIRDYIIDTMLNNNVITPHQHGFLRGHSTCSQLLDCLNMWTKGFEDHIPIHVLYIDFKKAFDSVSHVKLITKLHAYGLPPNVINWLFAFLSNRTQQVCINGVKSYCSQVSSGVPEGTVLGPTLFLLFINDLVNVISDCHIRLYADDVKLFKKIESLADVQLLQKALSNLVNWAKEWQLGISINKCACLCISRNKQVNLPVYNIDDIALPWVTNIKDLGVTISDDLSFSSHCSNIVKQARSRSILIVKSFLSPDVNVYAKAFKSYVRPILEYCSSVWSPFLIRDINLIESVQRSLTNAIFRKLHLPNLSYDGRLERMNLQKLSVRRSISDIVELFKICKGFSICNILSDRLVHNNSRRGHIFKLSVLRLYSKPCRSFIVNRSVNVWNSLPELFLNCNTISVFKLHITRFLTLTGQL